MSEEKTPYEQFIANLPDPDLIGTTEYRMAYDLACECDTLEMVAASIGELAAAATAIRLLLRSEGVIHTP